jgi:hypothetical protein
MMPKKLALSLEKADAPSILFDLWLVGIILLGLGFLEIAMKEETKIFIILCKKGFAKVLKAEKK